MLALDMWLDIDGTRRQNGSTSTMIFSPAFIVHYLSQFLALEPGDLINTGTPPGVGMGQTPPAVPARRRDHDARHHAPRHADPARHRPIRPRRADARARRHRTAPGVGARSARPGARRRRAARRRRTGRHLRHRRRALHRRDGLHRSGAHALPDPPRPRVDRPRRRPSATPADEAWIGKRVTGDTMLGCGHCEYCLAGSHHVCPDRFEVGIRDGWAGALAEQAADPDAVRVRDPRARERRRGRAGRARRQLAARRPRRRHHARRQGARARLRHHRPARRPVRARRRRRGARRRRARRFARARTVARRAAHLAARPSSPTRRPISSTP